MSRRRGGRAGVVPSGTWGAELVPPRGVLSEASEHQSPGSEMRRALNILAVAVSLFSCAAVWGGGEAPIGTKAPVEPASFAAVNPAAAGSSPQWRGDDSGEGLRVFSCPPNSAPEGELNCGFPQDTFNSGCNSGLQVFSPILCGQTVCGTAQLNGATRDTDWYEISLNAPTEVVLTFSAEYKAIVGFIAGTNGAPVCALASGVQPFTVVSANQTGEVRTCLGPGTWWLFTAPEFNQGNVACGKRYWMRVTCGGCPIGGCCLGASDCVETNGPTQCNALGGRYQGHDNFCFPGVCDPPFNDLCADAPLVTCNSTVFADLRNATFSTGESAPACASAQTVGSVWYRIQGTGSRLSVTTCDTSNLDPVPTDTIIVVYLAINGCTQPTFLACNDDTGCGPTGRFSRVCFNTSPGAEYLIQILPYDNLSRGVFKVDIECSCPATTPFGACCLAGGSCSSTTFAACAVVQGVFQGEGVTCAAANCPVISPPGNDSCDQSTPMLSVPGSLAGYTLFAAPDEPGDQPECGPGAPGSGVWYKVLGTGRRISVSTCNPETDFDTRIKVFCGDCETPQSLVCVAANDNATVECGLASETSWCSVPNQLYSILVAGDTGDSGNFVISASDAGPCTGAASCAPTCAVTCPGGSTAENEPPCGAFYIDATNGGCGTAAAARGAIACGQTVCGQSGVFNTDVSGGLGRDTDWFRFTVTQQSVVTWTVRAEFLVQAFILNDDCNDVFAYAGAIGNACQDVVVTATLEPGTYNAFVSPQFFQGVPCGDVWYGTLNCAPTAQNGACCLTRCSCTVTTEEDCLLNQGGFFFGGVGTTCGQFNCNPCPADMNVNGTVDTPDLVQFLGSYGRDPRGDFNCSGATDTADLTFFLSRFGLACPN